MTNWEYFVVDSDQRRTPATEAYKRWLSHSIAHQQTLDAHGTEHAFLLFLKEFSPDCEYKTGEIVALGEDIGLVQDVHFTDQRFLRVKFYNGEEKDVHAIDLKPAKLPTELILLAKHMVKDEMAGSCPLKEPTCLKK